MKPESPVTRTRTQPLVGCNIIAITGCLDAVAVGDVAASSL